jgi:hypothetical protein
MYASLKYNHDRAFGGDGFGVIDSRVLSGRRVDLQPSRPTLAPLSALTATTTTVNEDTFVEKANTEV